MTLTILTVLSTKRVWVCLHVYLPRAPDKRFKLSLKWFTAFSSALPGESRCHNQVNVLIMILFCTIVIRFQHW